jgi:hypothetical protein
MGSTPYQLYSIGLQSCSLHGERSLPPLPVLAFKVPLQPHLLRPPPLPISSKQLGLQMKSTPYLMRPLTGFHHLAIFAPYLPPHIICHPIVWK